VWVKNSNSIQSGWSSGASVNLQSCEERKTKRDREKKTEKKNSQGGNA